MKNRQCHDIFILSTNDNVADFAKKLKQMNGLNIWIFGERELFHDFGEQRLVDEWIINAAPTIIGGGNPLSKKVNIVTRFILRYNTLHPNYGTSL
ncbi:dihydrofolate reductase family protein [Clostridiaceae bacterium HFYG-1003]|nr:dihydrofolate reductase family protein [Clostridiaceae bacterium HFYG-1003]